MTPAPSPARSPASQGPRGLRGGPGAAPASAEDLPPWLDAPVADEHDPPAASAAGPVPTEGTSGGAAEVLAGGPAAPPHEVPEPDAPAAASPYGDRWHALARQLCERELVAALGRELALQSQLIELDAEETRFHLCVERGTLAAEGPRAKLEAALAQLVGRAVQLHVDVGPTSDTPARREAAERQARQRAAEQALRDDPLVVSLLQQFATARIVPGSVKPL